MILRCTTLLMLIACSGCLPRAETTNRPCPCATTDFCCDGICIDASQECNTLIGPEPDATPEPAAEPSPNPNPSPEPSPAVSPDVDSGSPEPEIVDAGEPDPVEPDPSPDACLQDIRVAVSLSDRRSLHVFKPGGLGFQEVNPTGLVEDDMPPGTREHLAVYNGKIYAANADKLVAYNSSTFMATQPRPGDDELRGVDIAQGAREAVAVVGGWPLHAAGSIQAFHPNDSAQDIEPSLGETFVNGTSTVRMGGTEYAAFAHNHGFTLIEAGDPPTFYHQVDDAFSEWNSFLGIRRGIAIEEDLGVVVVSGLGRITFVRQQASFAVEGNSNFMFDLTYPSDIAMPAITVKDGFAYAFSNANVENNLFVFDLRDFAASGQTPTLVRVGNWRLASDSDNTRPRAAAIRCGVLLLLIDSENGALRMIHADTLTPYKLATTIPVGGPRHMVITTKQELLIDGDD